MTTYERFHTRFLLTLIALALSGYVFRSVAGNGLQHYIGLGPSIAAVLAGVCLLAAWSVPR